MFPNPVLLVSSPVVLKPVGFLLLFCALCTSYSGTSPSRIICIEQDNMYRAYLHLNMFKGVVWCFLVSWSIPLCCPKEMHRWGVLKHLDLFEQMLISLIWDVVGSRNSGDHWMGHSVTLLQETFRKFLWKSAPPSG